MRFVNVRRMRSSEGNRIASKVDLDTLQTNSRPLNLFTNPPFLNLTGWWESTQAYTDVSNTSPCVNNGDLVYSMKDLSGNNRHLIQPTSIYRPEFRKNGTPLFPRINFKGRMSGQLNQCDISDLTRPATIYTVALYEGSYNCALLSLSPNANDGNGFELYSQGIGGDDFHLVQIRADTTNGFPTEQLDHVDMMQININSSGFISAVIGDNSPIDNNISPTPFTQFRFGGATPTDTYYNGSLALYECLLYKSAHSLNSGDGLLVKQYLNAKYNLGYIL
jgi:hypothetical protein